MAINEGPMLSTNNNYVASCLEKLMLSLTEWDDHTPSYIELILGRLWLSIWPLDSSSNLEMQNEQQFRNVFVEFKRARQSDVLLSLSYIKLSQESFLWSIWLLDSSLS